MRHITRTAIAVVALLMAVALAYAQGVEPVVVIDAPRSGAVFPQGAAIEFRGNARGLAQGVIAGNKLRWSSDISGALGAGESLSVSNLQPGFHTIILKATDARGREARQAIFITVKASVPASASAPATAPAAPPREATPKLGGLCYGPFRDNQSPEHGVFPTEAEMDQDLEFIAKFNCPIRTYGCVDTPASIPLLCDKRGIPVFPGAWLGKDKADNEREIAGLLKVAASNFKTTRGLIVGNEVLLRKDLSEEELIASIRKVKAATKLPVSTAEIWSVWVKNPRLADEVDFILVHIHPYWEGVAAEKAAGHVVSVWRQMVKAFPGKRIVIGETGWPSGGKRVGIAVPGRENQARFLQDFVALAAKENIETFWFDIFDEAWKGSTGEGQAGGCWGLYKADGSPKHDFLTPPQAIKRAPGAFEPATFKAPVFVYLDAGVKTSFEPSGFMGDLDSIAVDKACAINPHAGKTCVKLSYNGGGRNGWAGIYWQYPLNNWGDLPGCRIHGATKVSFWARGDKGGEKVEFKFGGIKDRNKKFHDSAGPVGTGLLELTVNWKKYEIPLKGHDSTSVIGIFCWTVRRWDQKECIIYLDDIILEGESAEKTKIDAPSLEGAAAGATTGAIPSTTAPLFRAASDNLEIPILTFADASPWKTDMGSNYGLLFGPGKLEERAKDTLTQELLWEKDGRCLSLKFNGLKQPHDFAGLWISVFGHIDDKSVRLPESVASKVTAVKCRMRARDKAANVKVELKNGQGVVEASRGFAVGAAWNDFTLDLGRTTDIKQLVLVIESRFQGFKQGAVSGQVEITNIRLVCGNMPAFEVPADDAEFLAWLRRSSLNHFVWNYREAKGGGFVLERNSFHDLVSVAGVGFAFPAFIACERDGLLTSEESRRRIVSMLSWLDALECRKGGGGFHGFPFHFLRPDGTRAGNSEVSTVDWAICAAGIRVAMQRYSNEPEIVRLGERLLSRADWSSTIDAKGRVRHGFAGDGAPLAAVWGDSFTEEALLICVEANAAGVAVATPSGFPRKSGFIPSWLGTSFTYNWLQLWTGPREPFKSNSILAFESEAAFARQRGTAIGYTACETFTDIESGFLKWDKYLGENGSHVYADPSNDVVKHLAVCPYGAALALPFARVDALESLKSYARQGFVHPLLGLPDSVRVGDLPKGATPIPAWTKFSIDEGPLWMAIESCQPQGGLVAEHYLKDKRVRAALAKLGDAFSK